MQIRLRQVRSLNLAARPFVNERPLKRLAVLVWLVVAVLTGLNAFLYVRNFSGGRLTVEQQRQIRERIEREDERLDELARELDGLDVAAINSQARYLNRRIVERTFAWSALFDHLAEAMPGSVRLSSLTPDFGRGRQRSRIVPGRDRERGSVILEIQGSAKTDQALLEFVDRLFAHALFRDPNLRSERRQENSEYSFSLDVIYDAPAPGAETAGAEEATNGDGATAAEPAVGTPPPA